MADWLTLKQLSEKRGIPETTLRYWKNLNYIASSTIDNVVMLDDNSVTRFLDSYQIKELGEDCLKRLIREKEAECEAMLAYFEDELYLLKTQRLYQPLFHVVIEELGALIIDDCQREIFLAISNGEPIARVAVRHQMTYARVTDIYSNILEKLGENTTRIATFRHRTMELLYSRFDTTDPTNTRISDILETHANVVLKTETNIGNVRELLQYASKYGWNRLKNLRGMGTVTYSRMIETLCNHHFIIVCEDKSIELSPEIATLLL